MSKDKKKIIHTINRFLIYWSIFAVIATVVGVIITKSSEIPRYLSFISGTFLPAIALLLVGVSIESRLKSTEPKEKDNSVAVKMEQQKQGHKTSSKFWDAVLGVLSYLIFGSFATVPLYVIFGEKFNILGDYSVFLLLFLIISPAIFFVYFFIDRSRKNIPRYFTFFAIFTSLMLAFSDISGSMGLEGAIAIPFQILVSIITPIFLIKVIEGFVYKNNSK